MVVVSLILALAISILAVIFALENPEIVTMSFLGREVEGSLALFILLAVILGVVIGVLVMTPGRIRHGLELRGQRKRIGELEKSRDEQMARAEKIERLPPVAPPPPSLPAEPETPEKE